MRINLPIDYLVRRPEAVLRLGELTVIRHHSGRASANNHVRVGVPMIMVVTHGRKTVSWGRQRVSAAVGDALFAAPGSYRMTEEIADCRALLLFFEPEVIAQFRARYPEASPTSQRMSASDRAFIVPMTPFLKAGFESLPSYLDGAARATPLLVEQKLNEIVLSLLDADRRVCRHLQTARTQARSLVRYVESQGARRRSLNELAHGVGQSLSTFKRRFRDAAGTSPAAFLRAKRLARAKRLLETTDHSVTEISLEIGFASTSHFVSTFRREFGATPQRLRLRQSRRRAKTDKR